MYNPCNHQSFSKNLNTLITLQLFCPRYNFPLSLTHNPHGSLTSCLSFNITVRNLPSLSSRWTLGLDLCWLHTSTCPTTSSCSGRPSYENLCLPCLSKTLTRQAKLSEIHMSVLIFSQRYKGETLRLHWILWYSNSGNNWPFLSYLVILDQYSFPNENKL